MRPTILFLVSCVSASPPPVQPESSPEPPPRTMTIAVPNDCPHVIVDIDSAHEANVTVACFTPYSGRTFLRSTRGPPLGIENEPGGPTRLVIEYVPLSELGPIAGLN